MSRIRDELDEAAARLHSNERAWQQAIEEYSVTVDSIRLRCPHDRVKHDVWEYGLEYTCRDCGASRQEPFGTVV